MIAQALATVVSMFTGRTFQASPRDHAFAKMLGGGLTVAGVEVDEERALTHSGIWKGVNLICNTIGKVSCHVLRDDGEDGWQRDKKHFAYRIVRRKANPNLLTLHLKKTLQGHAMLWGNGYAAIYRDENTGNALELHPLSPACTKPMVIDGQLVYGTRIGGNPKVLLAENVIHIRGLSWNGIAGYNVIEKARESIGAGLAVREFGARLFGQGANMSGILHIPKGLDENEEKRLRETFNEKHAQLGKAHRALILEEGAKFLPLTIPPEHAQFLQTREFDLVEIANWLSVPPHKIGHSGRTGYASLEQENQSYLDDSVDPWLVTWEEELNEKLLTEEQKENDSHRCEFFRDSLVRVDLETLIKAMTDELNNGGMNLDEYRRKRNRPAIPGGLGQKFRIPSNIQHIDEGPIQGPKKPPAIEDGSRSESHGRAVIMRLAKRATFDATARIVGRMVNQGKQAAKNGKAFCSWLEEAKANNIDTAKEIATLASDCCAAVSQDTTDGAPSIAEQIAAGSIDYVLAKFETVCSTNPEEGLRAAVELAGEQLQATEAIQALSSRFILQKEAV